MKVTKETLKKIIKEEIESTLDEAGGWNPHNPMYQWAVDQGYADDPRPKPTTEPEPEEKKPEPEAINVLLNKLDHMGVKIPDVVGLKPEQLAGVVADAIEKWKQGK